MTAIQTRNSVMAVVVESSEGTPVSPSGAGDFIALQDDADFTYATDTLENAELKSSLGSAKPIQGFENPTFSMSHYLKGSGTEGTAPEMEEMLEGAFGNQSIQATERDTVAGSTTTVINVDAGEGAEYARGQALLIKDSANGWKVRNVDSVATDALTMGFAVDSAPASGVNLGRAVFYSPADSGHQPMTVWYYSGNGGQTSMMAGGKVSEFSMTAEAGQLINSSFTVEGLIHYFNPVEITASDIYVDWTDDAGTFAATVDAKMYRDPHQLAGAIADAMNALTTETITVTYSNTDGKYTFAATGAVFSLLWSTGANTANTIGDKIGFDVAADDTGATSYEGDNPLSFAAEYTPSFDTTDPLVAKDNSVLLGDTSDNVCFKANSISMTLSDTRRVIDDICAESGRSGSIINAREATFTLTALLDQYEADKYRKFRTNANVKFSYTAGVKDSSRNWTPGTVVNLYTPTATISDFNLTDDDGLVSLELTLTTYVNADGEGEIFLNFL